MNKNFVIVSVLIVIVLVAFGVSSYKKEKNSAMMQKDNLNSDGMMVEGSKIEDTTTTGDKMMGKDTMEDKKAMMDDSNSMMDKKDDAMMQKAGSYEAYSADKVMLASDTHDVVLFFRASWCPTCIAVDKDIKANLDKIPSNLAILDVNYDNSSDLKKKYGVTYQHTFVQVDKDGNMIKKWSGSPTLASIVSEVK